MPAPNSGRFVPKKYRTQVVSAGKNLHGDDIAKVAIDGQLLGPTMLVPEANAILYWMDRALPDIERHLRRVLKSRDRIPPHAKVQRPLLVPVYAIGPDAKGDILVVRTWDKLQAETWIASQGPGWKHVGASKMTLDQWLPVRRFLDFTLWARTHDLEEMRRIQWHDYKYHNRRSRGTKVEGPIGDILRAWPVPCGVLAEAIGAPRHAIQRALYSSKRQFAEIYRPRLAKVMRQLNLSPTKEEALNVIQAWYNAALIESDIEISDEELTRNLQAAQGLSPDE